MNNVVMGTAGLSFAVSPLLSTDLIRVSLFVWAITFDMSICGDPASSYATAGLALRIIWPHKPHHYVKVEAPSVGAMSCYVLVYMYT